MTERLTAIQVGFGKAAWLHRQNWGSRVEVVGVVSPGGIRPEYAGDFNKLGLKTPYGSPADLPETLQPDFWDIAAPNDAHYRHVRDILDFDPRGLILLEKPVCLPKERDPMLALARRYPNAKVSVTEQYASSGVVDRLLEEMRVLDMMNPDAIHVETAKTLKTTQSTIWNNEFPHQVTVMSRLAGKQFPGRLVDATTRPARLANGTIHPLGAASVTYTADTQMSYFGSFDGEMQRYFPPLMPSADWVRTPDGDGKRPRWKIAVVEEDDITLVGQFEPAYGLPNNQGRVMVMRHGRPEEIHTIDDSPMPRHLNRVLDFFANGGENPRPIEAGVAVVSILEEMERSAETK